MGAQSLDIPAETESADGWGLDKADPALAAAVKERAC